MTEREFREREVAWRVFAHEFNSSRVEQRGGTEGTRSYLLSPLGATMNRVLLTGHLLGVEKAGQETPLLRTRLEDPTGQVTLTAGTYNPRALSFLSQPHPPLEVSVIGKTHLFVSDRGQQYLSVRAETFAPLDPAEVPRRHLETSEHTLRRLTLVGALEKTPIPSREELQAEGFPTAWVDGVLEARRSYPALDLEPYRRMVGSVLAKLDSG